jgi:quercetin dioxygenase-like cupin family protein
MSTTPERPLYAPPQSFDLVREAVTAGGGEGVVWTLGAGEDLNANLVRFGAGRGVGGHVNEEVDVIFVGVSGSGFVEVEGEEQALEAGKVVFVDRGFRRSTRAGPEGFAYLTVHRRRGPIRIGP